MTIDLKYLEEKKNELIEERNELVTKFNTNTGALAMIEDLIKQAKLEDTPSGNN